MSRVSGRKPYRQLQWKTCAQSLHPTGNLQLQCPPLSHRASSRWTRSRELKSARMKSSRCFPAANDPPRPLQVFKDSRPYQTLIQHALKIPQSIVHLLNHFCSHLNNGNLTLSSSIRCRKATTSPDASWLITACSWIP